MDLAAITWRKSSYSGNNGGDCVEVAGLSSMVAVRDSKNPGRAPLAFSRNAWVTFTTQIKS